MGFPGEKPLPPQGVISRNRYEADSESRGGADVGSKNAPGAMRIETTGQWGSCEARLQAEAKRQAVEWIEGPDKASSHGVGNEDLGAKPGKDESVGRRGAPQLGVQELKLEPQPARQGRKQDTQEAPSDPVEETQEAPPDHAEEIQEAPSDTEERIQEEPPDPKEETREVPSDPEEETWKAPSDPEEEEQKAPWDSEE